MAMVTGNADCTSGLSKRIYDYLTSDARNGFSSPLSAVQADSVKALCYAVARAMIDETVTNAVCTITVSPDAFGTGIPAVPVVTTGVVA